MHPCEFMPVQFIYSNFFFKFTRHSKSEADLKQGLIAFKVYYNRTWSAVVTQC